MAPEPERRALPRTYAEAVICPACRAGHHERCRGGNWCDCQHREPKPTEPGTGSPSGE